MGFNVASFSYPGLYTLYKLFKELNNSLTMTDFHSYP